MKNNILICSRFLVALIVLILCGLAFWGKFYYIKIFDFQLVPALQNGIISGLSMSFVLLIVVILLTLLFGRIYCSTLCPLGLYQELLMLLFKPFYKGHVLQPSKHYPLAYFLMAVSFGTLFGGTVVLLRVLDPYSLAGNAMSLAYFGLGFITVLTLLVFFKKRFFCTNICPVGAFLGLISRFSFMKICINKDKCSKCTLCVKSCPCGSIDLTNHTVLNETCVKCFRCLNKCSHNALYYGVPQTEKVKFNSKRRQFLLAGLVLATFGAAFRGGIELSEKVASKIKKVIIPAGSGSVQDFANSCLNCNLCVQNCPMKIIKPATVDKPFVHLDYGKAFCNYNCHKCSEVCPSGAIKRITLAEKQNTKIANAVISEEVCIKCGVCAMECPKQIIIKEQGEFPIIQFDKCIGCGKCASSCPVKAISIEGIDKQIILR